MANLIRLKQIESGSQLSTAATVGDDFNGSVFEIIDGAGLFSSSAQLDGSTLRNITIAPINSDGYSLIISGALAVVNATDLVDGGIGDTDSTVPAQIWLNADSTSVTPTDPSVANRATANQIDMGEF